MIKYKKEIVKTMDAESLKNEIHSLKINKGDMAKYIGIIPTTFSHWLSGRRRIPEKYFESIEAYINNYKKEKKLIKLEGRILLFDTVNKNGDIFPKDCKIDIPEKVPLTWDFNHEKVIGFANATKDDKGLVVKAETFSNEMIGVEDLSSIFEDGKFGAGGF